MTRPAGETINTPSMLCVEDYLDSLRWARGLGGLDAVVAKSVANFGVLAAFVEAEPWIDFLCTVAEHRSNTSVRRRRRRRRRPRQIAPTAPPPTPPAAGAPQVCLVLKEPAGGAMAKGKVDALRKLLEEERVAYDIGAYRDAPAGLRIWCGATVEQAEAQRLRRPAHAPRYWALRLVRRTTSASSPSGSSGRISRCRRRNKWRGGSPSAFAPVRRLRIHLCVYLDYALSATPREAARTFAHRQRCVSPPTSERPFGFACADTIFWFACTMCGGAEA